MTETPIIKLERAEVASVIQRACLAPKRTHNTSPQWQDLNGDWLEAGLSPNAIHGPQEVEHLSANRGIRFEWKSIKHHGEAFDGSVCRHVEEPGLEFQVVTPFDFNMGMPFGVAFTGASSAATAVADCVTAIFQRNMPDIVN